MKKARYPIYQIKYGTLTNPYPNIAVVSSGEGIKFAKRSLEDYLVKKGKAKGLVMAEVEDTCCNGDFEGVLSSGID